MFCLAPCTKHGCKETSNGMAAGVTPEWLFYLIQSLLVDAEQSMLNEMCLCQLSK